MNRLSETIIYDMLNALTAKLDTITEKLEIIDNTIDGLKSEIRQVRRRGFGIETDLDDAINRIENLEKKTV